MADDYDKQRDIDAEGQRAAIYRREENVIPLVPGLRLASDMALRDGKRGPSKLYTEAADEIERLGRECATLRRLLAIAFGVTYGLQNNEAQPFIDFKRDPVEVLKDKMTERIPQKMLEWARANPVEGDRLGVKPQ